MGQRKPILGVDFDGVIHSYSSGWQGIGVIADPPVPGAVRFLQEAATRFRVCIYSSRSETQEGRDAMRRALLLWAVEELGDEDGSRLALDLEYPESKPPALVSLDDRALCFDGYWPSVEWLLGFQPWNKRPGRLGGLGPTYETDRAEFLRRAVEPSVTLSVHHSIRGPFIDAESGEVTVVVPYFYSASISPGIYATVLPAEGPHRLARVAAVTPSMDGQEISITAYTQPRGKRT